MGILEGETVHFSMRIQLLVSKLGRSSKPSPRYLVVVSGLRGRVVSQALIRKQDRESGAHCHHHCTQWCDADGIRKEDSTSYYQVDRDV